jgi:hypothetical protein
VTRERRTNLVTRSRVGDVLHGTFHGEGQQSSQVYGPSLVGEDQ